MCRHEPGAPTLKPPSTALARLWRVLLVGILATAAWTTAAGGAPLTTVTSSAALPIQVPQLELLRDPTRQLDLAQVRTADIAAGFEPAPPGIPNLGTGRDAVWARFAVHNASNQPLPLLLALADPRTAQVAFWALDAAGRPIAERRDGRLADPEDRDRSHRWFLFDLPLEAGATATVYLRVTSDMGRRLDLRLTDRLHLADADRVAYGWLGLFFGALLFMLGYNLVLLVQLRAATYFWLCIALVGVVLWAADREGILNTLAWQPSPQRWSTNQIGAALAELGTFMFPVALLRLRLNAPALYRMHLVLAVVVCGAPVLNIWDPALAYQIVQAGALFGGAAMIATGIFALRWQRRAALHYLAAWTPMLIAVLLLVLANYGLTPVSGSGRVMTYLAILFMLLLLSLAQADRINELRRRAERAQAALRRNEQRLTELVDERTRELAVQRDRAEAASRAKTQFLANMSHDLRTPLNGVLGGAGLLARSPRLTAEELGHCGLIQRGGRQLLRLIDDLLDIARIEHDRLRPVIADCSLETMLADLARLTRGQAQAKGLVFRAEIAADLPERVRTDCARLNRVLQNLLDNAVKYTDAGSVSLTAGLDPAPAASTDDPSLTLLFTVSDTGHGIPEADRERLFAPFEQYHHAQQGSGLGLAICREIAQLLGGELTLESTPGRGSRFQFRLPVQRASGSEPPPADDRCAPIVGYAGPSRRILVIDDSEVNRLLMAGLLRQLGLEAEAAAGADEALALASRRPPDLVITDLRMPEVCGYAAVWQLRAALGQPRLPAIAASASPLPEPTDAAELGFDAFLLKPIEQEALIAAVDACLGLRWIRADTKPTSTVPAADSAARPEQPTPLPPRPELLVALELVESADWPELTDWCEQIAAAYPDCAAFIEQVRALLAAVHGPTPDTAETALRRLLADAR